MRIILLIVVFYLFSCSSEESRISSAAASEKERMEIILQALEMHHNKYNSYPVRLEDISPEFLSPYPENSFIFESWWQPNNDYWANGFNAKGSTVNILCMADISTKDVNCIVEQR